MFDSVLIFALFLLTISIIISLVRIFKRSSTISDRVLLIDSISYIIIAMVAILSILLDSVAYLVIILLIGILAFMSTIALCRFIERGVVIERKRSD
jgi:multicomponent Na+:H+ antiporter subunit F